MDVSLLLPIMVTCVGLYLMIRLRFFFVLHPVRTAGEFLSSASDRGARRSLFLALAGTLGVGNIFGVAAGIMIGGAGSLFWLFISSLFAMVIKYAETLLVFSEDIDRGGTSALLSRVFRRAGRLLSPLYAAFMLLLSLFMGCAMQTAAVIDVSVSTLSLHPAVSLFILIILLLPAILGGARKIESITEIIIPLTTLIYIICCFFAIFANLSRLPAAINGILSSAFNIKSAAGGCIGFLTVREGFARGILSNEAGVGTSAMAHSRSREREPHGAGLFAMCEVVFDSMLLCMLTGLAILVTVPDISTGRTPMSLVSVAFSSVLGGLSDIILPILILAFAYATLICWYFYGRECADIYFPRVSPAFPFVFVLFAFASGFLTSDFILYVIDILLTLMSIMTLSAIIKKTPDIVNIHRGRKRKNPD